MTAAPTFSQIKAQVAAIRKRVTEGNVIGIRAPGRWTGERTRQDGDRVYVIDQCDSPLAMRIALREDAAPNATKVLVTSLDDKDLSEDILVRLVKRRLFPLNAWEIVRNLFQAHAVDPRLTRHPWVADYLMEYNPQGGYPPATGGFLDAETAWPILLRETIGLSSERPDLSTILRWSTEQDAVARYRSVSKEFKEAASAWLTEVAGPAAPAVLRCVELNDRPDALPIGLALGVFYHPKVAGKLEKASGVMVGKLLDGKEPDERARERWSVAATEVIRLQITDGRAKRVILERADEILTQYGADEYTHVSSTSPLGFDRRLAAFGKILSNTLESKRYDAIESLLEARREVGDHEYATRDRSRLDCLDMAIRLVRWLRVQGERPTVEPRSLVEATQHHAQDGGFVDWARLVLRRGDSVRALSESYARLFDQVTAIREQQAKGFAELLKTWTEADHRSDALVPVERLIEEVVGPLAAQRQVLLVVIDGMSIAVCRELMPEIVGHEWIPLNRASTTGMLATGLAALPSLTEVSRTSLFCGTLRQGVAADEQAGFASHPTLKAACRAGQQPILFHKSSLRGDDDAVLAGDVRAEIESKSRRVVAVVINAVDELLAKGEQIDHRWTRDSIPVLAALLDEAKQWKRLVIITSDHGHVIDVNSRFSQHEGGERWRTASSPPNGSEVSISGRRVVIPEAKSIVVPWSEGVRYCNSKKFGYHGGANPQEMITPIVVLSPTDEPVAGWADAPLDVPPWWEEAPAPVAVVEPGGTPKPASKKPSKTLPLFDAVPEPAPRETLKFVDTAAEPGWIGRLLTSSLFRQQFKLAGRAISSDDDVRKLLVSLDARGGKMTTSALARSMNMLAFRLPGFLAVAQRVLNIDGFSVLTRDEASDTVELNRELLRRQFELE